MEDEIVKWMQTWLLFLALGGDNLNYLTSDTGQSFSVHTHTLYFPLFGDVAAVEEEISTKNVILDSGSRNIHFVAIANLSAYSLDQPHSIFSINWKSVTGAFTHETKVNFLMDQNSELRRVSHHPGETYQIYFNVIKRGWFVLLYLIFDLPITFECVGTHSFELLDQLNTTIAKSMEIRVKLKNSQVELPQAEWVCNSNSDYCMLLRMQGTNIVCQREETNSDTRSAKTPVAVFYKFPAWIVYLLFTLALVSIVVLIAVGISSLKSRMNRKGRTRQIVLSEM